MHYNIIENWKLHVKVISHHRWQTYIKIFLVIKFLIYNLINLINLIVDVYFALECPKYESAGYNHICVKERQWVGMCYIFYINISYRVLFIPNEYNSRIL